MNQWIFLISTLTAVYCRPQINLQEAPLVEIEKQEVVDISPKFESLFENSRNDPGQKQLEESTKEILAKIALVNEKQGLTSKKPKPFRHFFGYLISQENAASRQRADVQFKFPRDPFTNPILDYVERKNIAEQSEEKHAATSYISNDRTKEEDEVPPGHYIKRKITHQQTMLIPSPAYNSMNMQYSLPYHQNFYGMNMPGFQKPHYSDTNKNELEKQTIDNIKNIVENSQSTSMMGHSPYSQYFNPQYPVDNSYRVYGPYTSEQIYRPAKQWQWPLGQYFPIMIKDPFIHMVNAMTTMVEFGTQGQTQNACKHSANTKTIQETTNEKKTDEKETETKARHIPTEARLNYNIVDKDEGAELTVTNDDSNSTITLDIEDLQITDNKENPMKLNLSFRKSKQNEELTTTFSSNVTRSTPEILNGPSVQTLHITKTITNPKEIPRQSPPIRDQVLYEDELSNEEDIEKTEEIQISHEGNKKVFSKDNTGSGIFVHKIKVRKGGVAIAGPGGIATAGSGGTAIVGPNGFAYTHPDSLAIAGSGTKVVAVEPTISLSQVIMDHNKNKTRGDGHLPSRIGKIVAVGPVIYYNKG